jgi:restriction system protein
VDTPKYYECMNPILQALREGGGTLTNAEIVDAVIRLMQLPDDVVERQQSGHNMSEVEYRIAWAKSYLKQTGYLTQSTRGVWALTPEGKATDPVDERAIVAEVRRAYYARKQAQQSTEAQPQPLPDTGDDLSEDEPAEDVEEELHWKQQVLNAVLAMSPDAFERLSQRLLRECGFTQVEVTGRSGDGGIDGKGVLRLGGLINFQVVFQCKRYSGTVSAGVVRDFRGAMIGRADKGLIVTTGTFSRDARAEAIRDGAPAIDLVDGQELAELLKRYELGVKTVLVEKVVVDGEWFGGI